MSVKSVFALTLHALAVGVLAYGYKGLETTELNSFIIKQRGGHSQFLTIQALIITWFTMLVSLFCDIIPKSQALKNIKRSLFLIAMPLAVVVTTIYWTLMLCFPSLILQASPQAPSTPGLTSEPLEGPSSSPKIPHLVRIPLSLDLSLHAAPAISLLLDFFVLEKSYGPTAASLGATVMSAIFGIWYSAWVEWCAEENGQFNEFPGRAAIYAIVTVIAFISFRGLNALHLKLTGTEPSVKNKLS